MRGTDLLAALALAAIAGAAVLWWAPARYSPVAAVRIDEAPGLLTGWKLKALRDDPQACFAALTAASVSYFRLTDGITGPGCGFADAAMLSGSSVSWDGNIAMTCPLLAATMVWERHDLQPLAELHLGQRVSRIRHFGTYACRNINGAQAGPRSEHARANAVDIAGFVLTDGRDVTVLKDWRGDDAKGAFLRALRDRACGRFATVLGPDYNRAHADHFHFDMGDHSTCR